MAKRKVTSSFPSSHNPAALKHVKRDGMRRKRAPAAFSKASLGLFSDLGPLVSLNTSVLHTLCALVAPRLDRLACRVLK